MPLNLFIRLDQSTVDSCTGHDERNHERNLSQIWWTSNLDSISGLDLV